MNVGKEELIFQYISNRIKDATGIGLLKQGEFRVGYVRESGVYLMRVECSHNNHELTFIVPLRPDIRVSDSIRPDRYHEIEEVVRYLIEYISNGYKRCIH